VVDKMTLEYYSHVMHITSTVEGMLADDKDAIDALIAGFPAGTVSGAPKIRAMEIIEELEKDRRGVYAGAVGYLSVNGDIETCIALRTGVVHNNMLHVQAGGGVVADSSPEGEYQESRNKAKAVLSAAGAAF
jgi:anthranilate synthase component 1